MNLEQELFQQIESSLCAGDVTTLPDITLDAYEPERRSAPRMTPEEGTFVRMIPLTESVAPGPIDVQLRNFAPGGASFQFSTKISLDGQFVLLLPTPDGEVAVLCGVAYWQPLAQDWYSIGARFNRVLRQAQPGPSKTKSLRKAV